MEESRENDMSVKELEDFWKSINKEECNKCPLKDMKPPLIMKINDLVKVIVITEGPNQKGKAECIASFGNHPTYTFLYTLFNGKAEFLGNDANVYWTHVRKCFLKDGKKNKSKEDAKKALKICRTYLKKEIKALKPKVIVVVGGEALKFFKSYASQLKGKELKEMVFEDGGVFKNVIINGEQYKLVVVPHPSGRSRIWQNLSPKDFKTLEKIRENLKHSLKDEK